MKIERAFAFHEAGHLIVGLKLGLVEQGIVFRPLNPGEGAQAVYTLDNPELSLVRCFAGLLAQLYLLPDSIEPHLRRAYTHSLIFEPDHPYFNDLTDAERDFLSGAHTDLVFARHFAAQLAPDNSAKAVEIMRASEARARDLVLASAEDISVVATDIVAFGQEPEADHPHFVLYSAERAKKLIASK
jgi:hypothetical protein